MGYLPEEEAASEAAKEAAAAARRLAQTQVVLRSCFVFWYDSP